MSLLEAFLPGRSRKPVVPKGMRVYAVGDIHGRADLLEDLLGQIESDWLMRPAKRRVMVFLGDLIDRGPDSRGVVERLSTFSREAAHLLFLAGNHEEVLLGLLDGNSRYLKDWLRFGGRECVESYGVDPDDFEALPPQLAVAHLRKAIPSSHVQFLRAMADTARIGDYLFVHAGIRPGVPVEAQDQSDLRWIRGGFLDDERDHGFVVVHGHTIVSEVDWQANRIAIDTGAYQSGRLTSLVLEGSQRRLLQSGRPVGQDDELS